MSGISLQSASAVQFEVIQEGITLVANLQGLRCTVVIYSCRVHSLSKYVVVGVLYTYSDTFLQKIF